MLNAVELVLYGLYAGILYNHGLKAPAGTGVQVGQGVRAWFAGGVKIRGKVGNRALLIGFAASVMTLSKTVLYCASPSSQTIRTQTPLMTARFQRVLLWLLERQAQ